MELRALLYFVTVAEELHFGRAAGRLNIVQPAVSQQIARLERELGVQLLDRSPRTVRLTDAGHRVLAAARDTLAAAERVRAAVGRPASSLRIGAAPGLGSRLERGIDVLREHNPSLEVIVVEAPAAARLESLRRGDLDLALTRGPVSCPGLRVLPAWSEPLHVVVSTRHPAADREVIALAEIAGHVLRIPSRHCDPPLFDAVTAALDQAGVQPPLGRPVGTIEATMVELGYDACSWALLPADAVTRSGSTRVRSIPVEPPVAVPGNVVVAGSKTPEPCAERVRAAFRDPVGVV